MISSIPIYRAKKIDSNEYVDGYLVSNLVSNSNGMPPEVYYNIQNSLFYKYRIDPTTLSIHFPDMLDSQGNKIFASLQEDGKGGDCTLMNNGYNEAFCWDTLNACIVLKSKHYECKCFRNGNRKETTFNTYTIVGILQ